MKMQGNSVHLLKKKCLMNSSSSWSNPDNSHKLSKIKQKVRKKDWVRSNSECLISTSRKLTITSWEKKSNATRKVLKQSVLKESSMMMLGLRLKKESIKRSLHLIDATPSYKFSWREFSPRTWFNWSKIWNNWRAKLIRIFLELGSR